MKRFNVYRVLLPLVLGATPFMGRAWCHQPIMPPTAEERARIAELNATTPTNELIKCIQSGSYHLAIRAAFILGQQNEKKSVPQLIEILQQPLTLRSRFSAYAAFYALCILGTSEAASVVRERAGEVVRAFTNELLLSEADRKVLNDVRNRFCKLIAGRGTPEKQAAALLRHLEETPEWCRDALIQIGPRAVPLILDRLSSTAPSPAEKIELIKCLRGIKSPVAAPFLKRILATRKDDPIRGSSDQILGEAAAALIPIQGETGLAAVKKAFKTHRNWLVRIYIVRALGEVAHAPTAKWLGAIATDKSLTADTTASRGLDGRIEAIRDNAVLSAAKIRINIAQDRVAALLEHLRSKSAWVRTYAAQSLVGTNDPRAFQPCLEALSDSEPNVRRYAIETLGLLGDRRAVGPLKEALQSVELSDHIAAKRALELLGLAVVRVQGRFEVVETGKGLLEPFRDKALPVDQGALELFLSRGNDAGAAIAAALQSQDPAVRTAGDNAYKCIVSLLLSKEVTTALRAIAVIQATGDRCIPDLMAALEKVENPRVRERIALALAAQGNVVIPTIIATLNVAPDPDKPWIPDLFRALALTGTPGLLFLKHYALGQKHCFAILAARAIASSETAAGSKVLCDLLGSTNGEVRQVAIRGLSGQKGGDVTQRLLDALQDTVSERKAAGAALVLARDRKATHQVVRAAARLVSRSKDRRLRWEAIQALRMAGTKDVVFPLIRALADSWERNVLAADAALQSLDEEVIVQALRSRARASTTWRTWIRSPDPLVRAAAALLSPEDKNEGTNAWLQWARESPYPSMVALGLGRTGGEPAVRLLIQMLKHRSAVVRRAAVLSLARLRARSAIEPIKALLNDKELTIRLAARQALLRLQSR